MSGFVAILHADGRPVERPLLAELTEAMAYCGPDHRGVWSDGPVGLGHALLCFDDDPPASKGTPCSLDGWTRIVADARIDGQAELVAELRAAGRDVAADTPDARLILHAWAVWGERCLDHLVGDFAFALWDGKRRSLFCARDHFGVVPLYYAPLTGTTVVGNVLWALRRHPGVTGALNERAIGDYLLFGMKMDHADTTFADVHSVPPGHTLTVADGACRVNRYWHPPPPAEPHAPARSEERVERFRDAFDIAVSDRLRSARAGTHLSGGMDSTSIAATAAHILAARGGAFELRAYVIVYDRLIAEEEGRFAQLVAERIGIPLERLVADAYLRAPPHSDGAWVFPEPGVAPGQLAEYEISRRVASFARTLFSGIGGDPLLRGAPARSPIWRRLARRVLRRGREPPFVVPNWIAPDFARRIAPAERWHDVRREWHGVRGPRELAHPLWATIFGYSHPGACGLPLRVCFPFFDLRLARLVWEWPGDPLLVGKRLLREAMRDRLPGEVLERPKTLLWVHGAGQRDPRVVLAREAQTRRMRQGLLDAPGIGEYVDVERARSIVAAPDARSVLPRYENFLLVALWLATSARRPPSSDREGAAA